jgi:D-alanine--poly(phosphoribitol) ligase subunit 1
MKYDFLLKQFSETEINNTKIAIAGSDRDVDWKELKNNVEQLKTVFDKISIPQGHPIVIYGHKEVLFPVSILTCIHSGITYIPIDKVYPIDRIKNIIEKTGSQIIINCSDDETINTEFAVVINKKLKVVTLSTPDYKEKTYAIKNDILQYIMFTSGSTGEPKGVQIAYSSITAFVKWAIKKFGVTSEDVILNQALFTFDLSMWDLLNAIAHGATLILTSSELIKHQEAFIERIFHYKCTLWTSTPSFVYLFFRNSTFNSNHLTSLKAFYLMGEELPASTCKFLKSKFENIKIINAYGPTETTIITTLVEIDDSILNKYLSLPIGYAMPESELMIDKTNPDDKEGELLIAGDHVSVGYFKNEELNKQKFFTHNTKRGFRSGDIVYVEDGMFFYKGRNDDQIKMHGFRIELSEISNVLCKNELIIDAITIPLKRNNEVKKIISFVIVKITINPEQLIEQLLSFLSKSLPNYMIPGDIVIVKEFPYNANHKIDKAKLASDYIFSQTS